jgi:hypothetical protein
MEGKAGGSAAVDATLDSTQSTNGSCLNESELTPDCPDMVVRAVSEGAESERLAALNMALQEDIELAPEVLQRAYESDPSESIRLLAFTTFVDSVSDDATLVRDTLQSAMLNDSSSVQAEAQRRLQQLDEYEMAVAQTPPQVSP